MSKIEFTFSTFPHYFRKNGWLDPKPDGSHFKMLSLLMWIFENCSSEDRNKFHDHKLINLKPYHFIFARDRCYQETGLTEDEVRTRLKWMVKSKIVEKSPDSIPNRFTIYRVMTETFFETRPQLETNPVPNRSPTGPQLYILEEEDKKIRIEEEKKKSRKEKSQRHTHYRVIFKN